MKSIRFLFLPALWLGLASCQSPQTKITEETGGKSAMRVLVDTRSHLQYETYHISGSVHLHSSDFLILRNAREKERILDPDIPQIIERLARRGVSPEREIILISDSPDSEENKKWNWLLLQLHVRNVIMMSLDSYREVNRNRVPQPKPERAAVWQVERPQLILKQSKNCFVSWSDSLCL